MTSSLARRPRPLHWILAFVCLTCAVPAHAQTAAELFDDGRLHTLELTVHSRDWEDLQAGYLSNTYYPTDVAWNGVRVRNVGVRSRGKGSRSGTKPGLELEFDYYSSDQRFVGLRSLVLDNLWTDASMVREISAMALLRRVGVPASRESFARLVVNGEFAGLYVMVEPVNREFALAHIGSPGRLYEFRWDQPFYETYPGDELELYQTLFASRNGSSGSMSWLYGPIRDLFRAINQTPDGDPLAVGLDIPSIVTLAAADDFMGEYDGIFGYEGMNNVYLYQAEDGRSYFIPWDKDHAFWVADGSRTATATDHVLLAKMLGTQQVRQMYATALEAMVAAATGDDWLDATIARYAELVWDAAHEDTRKPYDNDAFAAAVADLRALARARTAVALQDAQRLRQE